MYWSLVNLRKKCDSYIVDKWVSISKAREKSQKVSNSHCIIFSGNKQSKNKESNWENSSTNDIEYKNDNLSSRVIIKKELEKIKEWNHREAINKMDCPNSSIVISCRNGGYVVSFDDSTCN